MLKRILSLSAAAFLMVAGVACDTGREEPAEQTQESFESAGESFEGAAEDVGEAGQEAVEDTGEAGEEAKEHVQDEFSN